MSYEEKVMSSTGSSAITPNLPDISESLSIASNKESPQALIQRHGVLHEHMAVLWDFENCPIPSDVCPEDVASNVRMALRVHPIIKGAVTIFSAYGDFNAFPRRLREGCQRTGVKLVDVPNGRKDAADKAILIDMFLFVLDNHPPSTILLISGDVDFAPALHILGQRGYTIILVIPARVGVSSALINAAQFIWDWPSEARGEGFLPPKTSVPRGYGRTGSFMRCNNGDNHDGLDEDDAVVYKEHSQNEHSSQAHVNQRYHSSHLSRELSSVPEYNGSYLTAGCIFTSSRCRSIPSAVNEGTVGDRGNTQDHDWWVMPGDIQGLKGQLVRILEMFGGSLPLVRIPQEYIKLYGRPLYMVEYGVNKLMDLIQTMQDAFVVVGQGHKKLLCLRKSTDSNAKKLSYTPLVTKNDNKGKGFLPDNIDSGICLNMCSSSDDLSDEEKAAYDFDDPLGSFRIEVQELLVCYSIPIPLICFEDLYERRYKKSLNYQSFGVDGLEELLDKVRDVAELHDDQGSKRKFLVCSCISG